MAERSDPNRESRESSSGDQAEGLADRQNQPLSREEALRYAQSYADGVMADNEPSDLRDDSVRWIDSWLSSPRPDHARASVVDMLHMAREANDRARPQTGAEREEQQDRRRLLEEMLDVLGRPDGAIRARGRIGTHDYYERLKQVEAERQADGDDREEMARDARRFFDDLPDSEPRRAAGGRPDPDLAPSRPDHDTRDRPARSDAGGGGRHREADTLPTGPLTDPEIGQLIELYPTQLGDNYTPEQVAAAIKNVKGVLSDFDPAIPFRDRVAELAKRLNKQQQRNRGGGKPDDPLTVMTNKTIHKLAAYGKDPAAGRRGLRRAGIDMRPTEPVRPAPPVRLGGQADEAPAPRPRRSGPPPFGEPWEDWEIPLDPDKIARTYTWDRPELAPPPPPPEPPRQRTEWVRDDTDRDTDPVGWRPAADPRPRAAEPQGSPESSRRERKPWEVWKRAGNSVGQSRAERSDVPPPPPPMP
jgi:hypothetical protein